MGACCASESEQTVMPVSKLAIAAPKKPNIAGEITEDGVLIENKDIVVGLVNSNKMASILEESSQTNSQEKKGETGSTNN